MEQMLSKILPYIHTTFDNLDHFDEMIFYEKEQEGNSSMKRNPLC